MLWLDLGAFPEPAAAAVVDGVVGLACLIIGDEVAVGSWEEVVTGDCSGGREKVGEARGASVGSNCV